MTARPHSADQLQSAVGAFDITPDDDEDLAEVTRAIFLGGDAELKDLKVDLVDGSTVIFFGIATGVVHPLQVRRVHDTNTTAENIVGLV
jgi:hypothetical protein